MNAKKTNRHASIHEKLAKLTEIPDEILSGESSVYVIGTRKAEITGCRSVLEYTASSIIFRTKEGTISMCGTEMEICSLLNDQITVRGEISALHFSCCTGEEQ